MNDDIVFPMKREFAVNVENLSFKLIIDKLNVHLKGSSFLSNTYHIHSHIELFVCTKGRISISTPDGIVDLLKGDAAFVPPNYPHTRIEEENDTDSEWCSVNFVFVKKQVRESNDLFSVFDSFFSSKNVITVTGKASFCSEILNVVQNVPDYETVIPALRVVSAVSVIVNDAVALTANVLSKQQECHTEDIDLSLLYKLNHIINSCFMNDFTNAQIAEMLFISERQLSRISSKYYGMSTRQAIIERRLSTAEKLLSDTNKTVESIGETIGYNSKSGFYRDFRKKYGLTPVEYRKRLKK